METRRPLSSPGRLELFLHGIKTFKLIRALMTDSRVSRGRKSLFVGGFVGLLALLVLPVSEVVLNFVMPVIGALIGIPIDTGLDWTVFALLVVHLIRFFPAVIVSEHYERIFHKSDW